MTREENITAQQRFREAINSGDFGIFDEVVAPDALDHDPAPGQERGPAGFRSFFGELRTAFPDLHVSVEQLVADDEHVAFAYTVTGTHKGSFLGIAPTGRQVRARGVQLGKFASGKLVERWGSSDLLGILQQLGHAPI
ncbi:hypothetical protein KDH_58050 [Dictyobacter sp. S3.2.2.5]|uniref:Ester cyclase n=1 Tax=Dictyobacter halimunensis TaxID=3026934 RepID=A0ABQ6G2G3_9CHLR|nr:hypothetical protein KDH_58050 [Dictyobacter sp. S3.2.2.5]